MDIYDNGFTICENCGCNGPDSKICVYCAGEKPKKRIIATSAGDDILSRSTLEKLNKLASSLNSNIITIGTMENKSLNIAKQRMEQMKEITAIECRDGTIWKNKEDAKSHTLLLDIREWVQSTDMGRGGDWSQGMIEEEIVKAIPILQKIFNSHNSQA